MTSMGSRSSRVSSNRPASVTRGGVDGNVGLGEGCGADLAEALDVERAAAADVLDAPAHLGGAAARVGAAQVDVALLRRAQRGAALGALGRHDELALGAVAQLDDGAEHLGDDVARLAQHDGVADEHALELDDVLVVEGRLPHLAAGDAHLLHDGEGGGAAGAADAHDDVEQLRVDLLGRVLVGDGPARGAARGAELVVQLELVDLDDDAVDLVLDRVAVLAVVGDEPGGVLGRVVHAVVGAGRQTPRLQQLVDLALGGHGRPAPRADAVHEHPQPAQSIVHARHLRRRLALLLLPQRAARGVARVGELALAGLALQHVELVEGDLRQEDLAAHLHEVGQLVGGAVEPVRDARHERHVHRDVLPHDPVAARGRADERAALVAQVDREAVDLQLAEVAHRPAGVALDLRRPRRELVAR